MWGVGDHRLHRVWLLCIRSRSGSTRGKADISEVGCWTFKNVVSYLQFSIQVCFSVTVGSQSSCLALVFIRCRLGLGSLEVRGQTIWTPLPLLERTQYSIGQWNLPSESLQCLPHDIKLDGLRQFLADATSFSETCRVWGCKPDACFRSAVATPTNYTSVN